MLVSLLLFIIGIYFIVHTHKINKDIDRQNKELKIANDSLIEIKDNYIKEIDMKQ